MDARAATIADRYELRERVGQGGCGVVYRAADRHTGQLVAIKMLSHATRQDPSFVERLVREQQALQALAGTHAVGAIDLCRANSGELCLVMEWLEGTDLEQHLTALEKLGTPLSVDQLWRVVQPVLQTLEKAHELGIVHRDIKPANIFLLSENRGVRLLDFGFSRLKSSAALTAADTVMGSPSYIAPEAWQHGSKAIDKQADLYAAGVIVFRALSGRVPFEGASLVETMKLVTTAPRPSLCELRGDLPTVMDTWVAHALAIDPERRFQYASSFLEALAAALAGVELPSRTLPAASRHPETAPPPKTTAGERQNALSVAFGRAASLLKRVASSLSRAPAPPLVSGPIPAGHTTSDRDAVSAIRSKDENARFPEPDSLMAELLPPSLPPPPVAKTEPPEVHAPLAPSPMIAIEGPSEPPVPVSAPPPSEPAPAMLEPLTAPAPLPTAALPDETSKADPTPLPSKVRKPRTARKPRKRSSQKPVVRASRPPATSVDGRPASSAPPEPSTQEPNGEQPPRRRASKKKAAKRGAAQPESGAPAAAKLEGRAKKPTTGTSNARPNARKRASKPTAPGKRAAASPTAKSARKKSDAPAAAQTSRRTSKQ
ncbi:MAG TPA: protein kinase [Polyangiaceae bacterium]|nr:protein kinase [Polyangiaceae bacterium]